MKNTNFTESQIIKVLKENEQGRRVEDLCCELGIHKATFYIWRKKYSGMDASQLKELKELKEENRRLKQMYADLSLDNAIFKDVLSIKYLKPSEKKQCAEYLQRTYQVSIERSCKPMDLSRSMWYYQSKRDDSEVVDKMSELAE